MSTPRLTKVRVAGFRSLKDVTLEPGNVTVLIGPNGAGKSNVLSALRMLALMRTHSLRRFVAEQGGASALLHYGPAVTRELAIQLELEADGARYGYSVRLAHAAGDQLIIDEERISGPEGERIIGTGHFESVLPDHARFPEESLAKTVSSLLSRMSFFHFHDTSSTSALRQSSTQADNRYLRSDGSNLASLLHRLATTDAEGPRQSWNLIQGLVRRVAPFIKSLEPDLVVPELADRSAIRLYWTDERDHRFDTSDFSDGTLRAIALITAFAQPPSSLPSFISVDEPELGLHPAALALVASLIQSVASRAQVVVATQSPALLDELELQDVRVVEQRRGETSIEPRSSEELAAWLDEYSLSELYDKNVLGGRP